MKKMSIDILSLPQFVSLRLIQLSMFEGIPKQPPLLPLHSAKAVTMHIPQFRKMSHLHIEFGCKVQTQIPLEDESENVRMSRCQKCRKHLIADEFHQTGVLQMPAHDDVGGVARLRER